MRATKLFSKQFVPFVPFYALPVLRDNSNCFLSLLSLTLSIIGHLWILSCELSLHVFYYPLLNGVVLKFFNTEFQVFFCALNTDPWPDIPVVSIFS